MASSSMTSSKRPRSSRSPSPTMNGVLEDLPLEDDMNDEHCSICLLAITDRCIVPTCSHEFCFDCLMIWSDQSRRCPLCSQSIGDYLIHNIRSRYDYQKHYLNPLRTSPPLLPPLASRSSEQIRQAHRRRRRPRERRWGGDEHGADREADRLDHSISKRRWIYQHDLYAKHVASNSYTRYRPFPTPAQFSASQELISRATAFLRRELRVWINLDVEFLTTFTVSLMKAIDIRSESAVKLLAEFLDMDSEDGTHINAEHFAHEVYSYMRSPYKDLFVYDTVVQYDTPSDVDVPSFSDGATRRVQHFSRSRSPKRRRRPQSSSRSVSWSPSGRRRSISRDRRRDLDNHTSSWCRDEDKDERPEQPYPSGAKENDNITTPKPSIDIKGKSKAVIVDESPRVPASRRLPRRRTLLQSVQDYLGTNVPQSNVKTVPLARPLSRLSGELASTEERDDNLLAKEKDMTSNGESARASLLVRLGAGNSDNVADEGPPMSSSVTIPPDVNINTQMDQRMKLLGRLMREKKKAAQDSSLEVDLDGHAVEAKLKKRTLLKVRLAAEKKRRVEVVG